MDMENEISAEWQTIPHDMTLLILYMHSFYLMNH